MILHDKKSKSPLCKLNLKICFCWKVPTVDMKIAGLVGGLCSQFHSQQSFWLQNIQLTNTHIHFMTIDYSQTISLHSQDL